MPTNRQAEARCKTSCPLPKCRGIPLVRFALIFQTTNNLKMTRPTKQVPCNAATGTVGVMAKRGTCLIHSLLFEPLKAGDHQPLHNLPERERASRVSASKARGMTSHLSHEYGHDDANGDYYVVGSEDVSFLIVLVCWRSGGIICSLYTNGPTDDQLLIYCS